MSFPNCARVVDMPVRLLSGQPHGSSPIRNEKFFGSSMVLTDTEAWLYTDECGNSSAVGRCRREGQQGLGRGNYSHLSGMLAAGATSESFRVSSELGLGHTAFLEANLRVAERDPNPSSRSTYAAVSTMVYPSSSYFLPRSRKCSSEMSRTTVMEKIIISAGIWDKVNVAEGQLATGGFSPQDLRFASRWNEGVIKINRSLGSVDPVALFRVKQQDAADQCGLYGVGTAEAVSSEQFFDKRFFPAKPAQQSKVLVRGEPSLGQVLNSKACDETELPAALFTKRLNSGGDVDQVSRGWRNLANQRCCSTRPEVASGRLAATAILYRRPKAAMLERVSLSRTSSSGWASRSGPKRFQRSTYSLKLTRSSLAATAAGPSSI